MVDVTPASEGFDVRYASPSQGEVVVGWEGPMNVAGEEIAISDYPRMSNPYVEVGFGDLLYEISDGAYRLTLDFEAWTRRASGNAAGAE